MTAYWSLRTWGWARWAGYCPFVLANDNGSGVSSKPITETLYRTKTTYYDAKTVSGKSFLRTKFGSATNVDWVQVVSTVHDKMGDVYYARRTSSNSDVERSYDLNDDGSSSGTSTEAETPTNLNGPVLASYNEVSRSATQLVVDYKEFGVTVLTVTCTLSTAVTFADVLPVAQDLLDTIDLQTPDTDYTPGVAQTYPIDLSLSSSGTQNMILCPMPTEYRGEAEEPYYFELKYTFGGSSEARPNIKITYERGGSGLTTKNQLFKPTTLLDHEFGELNKAVQGCSLNKTVDHDGTRLSYVEVWKSRGKLLVDGTKHRYSTTVEHSGGPIENAASFAGFDNGTLTEVGEFAGKVAGILPPESFTGFDTGIPGWDTPVYWLPYYIIVDLDEATSTETVKGAAIFASLL